MRIHSGLFDIKVDLNVDAIYIIVMPAASGRPSLGGVLGALVFLASQYAVLAVRLESQVAQSSPSRAKRAGFASVVGCAACLGIILLEDNPIKQRLGSRDGQGD